MNADLIRFVRDALGRGLPREAIRDELRKAGWRADEVDAALAVYAESAFPVPVPRRRPYLNAREAFLYLVLFATLYTSAFNTGQVLFALIERWLPDPMRSADWRGHTEWVRGATAGILIAFPIFLFLSRVIGREVAREPERLGSPIRKWLTYITLFIAALVIIGDLTVLVTRVLGGELPPRFLLKVLVVLLIAGTVFGHYLGELRREETGSIVRTVTGVGARVAGGAVLATMVCGLILSGSPPEERRLQLDEQRVRALGEIAQAIQSYHDRRQQLPDSLGALSLEPSGPAAATLRDPESSRPYGYRRIGPLSYELCAEFLTAAHPSDSERSRSEFWRHGAGLKCFQLEVERRTR